MMSAMDQEFLLSINKSDSDEVEEFKLQPSRNRRKKKGVHTPDAKISAPGGSSLLSWRCAVTFIVMTALVSGGLILAFFIMNMESEISNLKLELGKVKERLSEESVKTNNEKATARRLEDDNSRIKQMQWKIKQLEIRISLLNNTKKSQINTPKQLSHRISLAEKDLDMIKTSLARTGGDIDKSNDKINSVASEVGTLQTSVKKLTNEIEELQDTENPDMENMENNFTQPPEDKKDTVDEHFVNKAVQTVEEKMKENKKQLESHIDLELSRLKSITESLNRTHTKRLQKLDDTLSIIANPTSTTNNTQELDDLKKEINKIEHNEPNANMLLQILTDVKYLQNVTKETQQDIMTLNKTMKKLTVNEIKDEAKEDQPKDDIMTLKVSNLTTKVSNLTKEVDSHTSMINEHHERLKQLGSIIANHTLEIINIRKMKLEKEDNMKTSENKEEEEDKKTEDLDSKAYSPTNMPSVTTTAIPSIDVSKATATTTSVKETQDQAKPGNGLSSDHQKINAPVAPMEVGLPTTKRTTTDVDHTAAHTYPPNFTGKVYEQKAENKTEDDFPRFSTEDNVDNEKPTETVKKTSNTTAEGEKNSGETKEDTKSETVVDEATSEPTNGSQINDSTNIKKEDVSSNPDSKSLHVSNKLKSTSNQPLPEDNTTQQGPSEELGMEGNDFEEPADEEGEAVQEDDDDVDEEEEDADDDFIN